MAPLRSDEKTPPEGMARRARARVEPLQSVPPKAPPPVVITIPPDSTKEMMDLGRVLRAVAQQEQTVHDMALRVDTLTRELNQHRRDLEHEKAEQFEEAKRSSEKASQASKQATKQTSTRMAALLGTLFVLYQEAAPVLHELWKVARQ